MYFLSKIIPNNALFVLTYLLQTLENLSLSYILKAMIMRVVMPPFAAHFQGGIWWVFTYLSGSSKFGNKWHFTSWMEKQHEWNWQLIHIHIIPLALGQLAASDLSSHGSCTRVLMFVLPMQQSCWSTGQEHGWLTHRWLNQSVWKVSYFRSCHGFCDCSDCDHLKCDSVGGLV